MVTQTTTTGAKKGSAQSSLPMLRRLLFLSCLIAVIFFGLKHLNFLAKEKSSNAVELKTDKFRKARQECTDSMETSMQKDNEGLSKDFLYQDCMLKKGYFLIDKQSLNHVQ